MIARNHHKKARSKSHGPRRGAMFAYFMVYLMLAGATTATAGMLLHQMFRARTADEDRGNGIRQLLRLDRQLRSDWTTQTGFDVQSNGLILQTNNQTSIEYNIQKDRLQRIVRAADLEVQASDRFQFPKGSILEFANLQSPSPPGVKFRLISLVPEPTSKVKKPVQKTNINAGRLVEIFLTSPPKDTQTLEQQSADTDSEATGQEPLAQEDK